MSNVCSAIIQEIQGNIQEIEEQLVTFRKLLRQTKNGKFKLDKQKLEEIILALTQKKEALKCSIPLYQSILPKRKELLQNKSNEEE